MREFRKMMLSALFISVIAGGAAGITGGILAVQFAQGDLGAIFLSALSPLTRYAVNQQENPNDAAENSNPLAPPLQAPSTDEEAATTDVVRAVAPAVVSIAIEKEITPRSTGPLFPEEFFRQFGFPFEIETPRAPSGPPQRQRVGGGTGFIISSDGLIVTNKHVVFDDAATYTVIAADGKEYAAEVLARDPFVDLAILKIEAKELPTVRLGNSDALRLGETVIAIGNALSEFSNTVTKGIVSGINRRVVAEGSGIGSEVIEEAIQTDAAINPGNSGGPLVNLRGEVVGVNTAVSRAGQLIGFAIPINQTKSAIASVKAHGRIIRPWLGVRYIVITPQIAQKNQLNVDYGALLVRGSEPTDLAVIPGAPADKAGLLANDIILEIDGVKITRETSLAQQIQKHLPGDEIMLKVLSRGDEKELRAILEESPQ